MFLDLGPILDDAPGLFVEAKIALTFQLEHRSNPELLSQFPLMRRSADSHIGCDGNPVALGDDRHPLFILRVAVKPISGVDMNDRFSAHESKELGKLGG